jgi:hypothetical protein
MTVQHNEGTSEREREEEAYSGSDILAVTINPIVQKEQPALDEDIPMVAEMTTSKQYEFSHTI